MKLSNSTCELCRNQGITFTMRIEDRAKFVWACHCPNGTIYRQKYSQYRAHIDGHIHWDRYLDKSFKLTDKKEEKKVIDIFD